VIVPHIDNIAWVPIPINIQNPITKEVVVHPNKHMIYGALLPDLFKFSFYAKVYDIPKDLHGSVVWALETILKQWENGNEKEIQVLYAVCGIRLEDPERTKLDMKYAIIRNARCKSAILLLNELDKPIEAAEYFRLMVETDLRRTSKPWLHNPQIYALYGEALARSGSDDKRARKMLELSLEAPSTLNDVTCLIRARVFLSRVLRRLDKPALAMEHESIATKWFRSNPRHFPEAKLRALLMPEGNGDDPIIEALGGAKWIYNEALITKAVHNTAKACQSCGLRPIQKKLFKCSRCEFIYYCSPACQKVDMKAHKDFCDDAARILYEIEVLKQVDPETAAVEAFWRKWDSKPFHNNYTIHALGLHRNHERAKTHILFKLAEYTPQASKDLRYKFRVIACSVFCITDILVDLEKFMGLDAGEGEEYINGLIQDVVKKGRWPMLSFVMGNQLRGWLSTGSFTADTLRETQYNPNWRKLMNIGEPPKLWNIRPDLRDQEHIF